MEKKVSKYVSYARTSTITQKNDKTIELQNQKLDKFEKEHDDILIVDKLIDDGISGTKSERPAYLKLKKYMEDPEIDGIIATQLDRLGRSNYELQKLFEEVIKKNKKNLILLSHNLDTKTKEGKFAFDVLCAQVEYDLRNIKERMSYGYRIEYEKNPEKFGRPKKEIPERLKKKMIHWYKIQKNGFKRISDFIKVEDIKTYPEWFQRNYIGFGITTKKEKEKEQKRFYMSPMTVRKYLKLWKVKIRPIRTNFRTNLDVDQIT